MLLCQRNSDLQPDSSSQDDFNWTAAAKSYPNLEEAPLMITRNRQQTAPRVFTTTCDPDNLQGTQLEVYTAVRDHFTNNSPTPPSRALLVLASHTSSSACNCYSVTHSRWLHPLVWLSSSLMDQPCTLYSTYPQEENSKN